MRKILFTILFSLVFLRALAQQWNTTGDNFSTGSLTIGSTAENSNSTLTIKGPNFPFGVNSKRDVTFEFSSAGTAIIRAYRGSSWDTYLQFLTSNYTNGTPIPRLHINGDGKVGVGTIDPKKKLEVITDPNDYVSFAYNLPLGQFTGIHFGYSEDGNSLYRKSAIVFERIDAAARGKIHLLNNNVMSDGSATLADAKLTIDVPGNVGIGTTSPENIEGWHKVLDVNGSDHSKIIATTSNIRTGLWSHNSGFYGAPAGGISGTHTNHPYSIVTNKTPRMVISSNGQVGIGTINPDPNYLLSVNGKIKAREVKVTLDGWADYVFNPNYQLRPLSEVESYIKEFKHLPEVPTEDEVKNEGIDLGKMDATLLKKIEELTLYMIELKKDNDELRKIVQSIEQN